LTDPDSPPDTLKEERGSAGPDKDRRFIRPDPPAKVALRAIHTILQFLKGLEETSDDDHHVLSETLVEVEDALRRKR